MLLALLLMVQSLTFSQESDVSSGHCVYSKTKFEGRFRVINTWLCGVMKRGKTWLSGSSNFDQNREFILSVG